MKYENVYTISEENSHRFYQLPKELFVNESYKGLSISAKMIYSFLLDRKELSRTNNWIDEYGQVFLLFTRKHVGEMLNLSDKPVTNAFKELIKADLIKEERQGLNKPNKIYVCKINYGIGDSPIQESEYIRSNDTEIINTEKNNKVTAKLLGEDTTAGEITLPKELIESLPKNTRRVFLIKKND